jgi:hypothetical protein
MKNLVTPLLVLVVFTAPSAVNASNLGPPTITGDIGDFIFLTNAGTITGGTNGGVLTVSASYASGTGAVSVVQSSYNSGFDDQENAEAKLISEFEVLGPANNNVALDFSVNGSASASAEIGGFTSQAQILADVSSVNAGYPGNLYSTSAVACAGETGCASSASFNVDKQFLVSTDAIYYVTIEAIGSSLNGTLSATVDPSVTFDPSFVSTGYSIIYSADATRVPEPATAWLMLCGLGGLGLLMRRRSGAVISRVSAA